jgi:hypothetical protein
MDPSFLALVILAAGLGFTYLGLRAHQIRVQHREHLAALDKGVDIKPILLNAVPAFGHRVYLLRGLVWFFAGAALLASLTVIAPFWDQTDDPRHKLEFKLIRARTLKDIGATEAQLSAMENEIERAGHARPNPRLIGLVGLIPMFTGFAYLIFYALEEKRMRRLPPA